MKTYQVILSHRYKRSLKRFVRHKDFDRHLLERVIVMLTHNVVLEPQYRDHELKGNFKGYRECHVKSDLLLVYQKYEDTLVLLLVDIGSHSSVFK